MSLQIPAHLVPLTRDAMNLKHERPPYLLHTDQWNWVEAVPNLWVGDVDIVEEGPPAAKKRRLVEDAPSSVYSTNGLSSTAWERLMPWQQDWLKNTLKIEARSTPALHCFYEDAVALVGQDTIQKQQLLWEVKRPHLHFLIQHCGVGKTWTFLAYIRAQLVLGEKALIVAKGLRSDIREIWGALGGTPNEILELQANRSCDKFLKAWADPRWKIIVMPATSLQHQMEYLDCLVPPANPVPKPPAILVLDEAHEKANLIHAITVSQTWMRASRMQSILLVTASRDDLRKNWFNSRSVLQSRSAVQRTPHSRCALVGLLGSVANGQWQLNVPPMPVKPTLTMLLPTLTVKSRLVPQEDLDEALLSMLPQHEASSFLDGTMGHGDCYATPAMERVLQDKMDRRRDVIRSAHEAREHPQRWSKLISSLSKTEVATLTTLVAQFQPSKTSNEAPSSSTTRLPTATMIQKVLAEEHFALAYAVLQHHQDSTQPLPSLPDCPVCMSTPVNICVCVPCCHLFCTPCLEESLTKLARSCPTCRTTPCGLLPLDRPLKHKKHVCLAQDLVEDYGKRVIIIVHGNRGAQRLHNILADTNANIKVWQLIGSSMMWERSITTWREAPSPNTVHVLLVPLHSEHKEVAGVNLQMANKLIFMTTPELGQERLMQVLGRVIRPVKTPHQIDIVVYHNGKERPLDELNANIQRACAAAAPAS